jgi:hypothetical protein
MNPYIKMYLISEGDRKLLQLLKHGEAHVSELPAPTVTSPMALTQDRHQSQRDTDSEDSEMDRMHERLKNIHPPVDYTTLYTNTKKARNSRWESSSAVNGAHANLISSSNTTRYDIVQSICLYFTTNTF